MNDKLAIYRFVSSLSAVCILDASSVPDKDDVVVDEGSTVFDITQVSDLSSLASSDFDDALRVVDGTRKDKEAKREQWFTAKVWVNESIATYLGRWALPCDSSRRLSTQIKIHRKDVFEDWNILALVWLVKLSRSRSWLRRPPTSTILSYSGCDRWGVHFGGCGVRLLAGPDLHRRSPD